MARIDIELTEAEKETLKECANRHYSGNLSRFLRTVGLLKAVELMQLANKQEIAPQAPTEPPKPKPWVGPNSQKLMFSHAVDAWTVQHPHIKPVIQDLVNTLMSMYGPDGLYDAMARKIVDDNWKEYETRYAGH